MTNIFLGRQICFIGDDGYMYCNAIKKQGRLVSPTSSKYWRFLPKKKIKKLSLEEEKVS